MQQYFAFFQTLHDETSPTGYLGHGTHYSVLRAIVFHDSLGNPLSHGQFMDFAVIWDADHDIRVMEPIEEIYRRGLLSGFVMFGERRGSFSAILSTSVSSAIQAIPFNSVFLKKVDELALPVHSANCLKKDNIVYIGNLVQKTEDEMLRTPNFGRKSLNFIKEVLVQMGLHLGMEVPGWPPENIEELVAVHARESLLSSEVNAICQALNDPWRSSVVPLGRRSNPIIQDEDEKVSLYLKSLQMLWQLGIVQKEHEKRLEAVPLLIEAPAAV